MGRVAGSVRDGAARWGSGRVAGLVGRGVEVGGGCGVMMLGVVIRASPDGLWPGTPPQPWPRTGVPLRRPRPRRRGRGVWTAAGTPPAGPLRSPPSATLPTVRYAPHRPLRSPPGVQTPPAEAGARVAGPAAGVAAGGVGSAAEAPAWDAGSGPARRPGRESEYRDELERRGEVPAAERLSSARVHLTPSRTSPTRRNPTQARRGPDPTRRNPTRIPPTPAPARPRGGRGHSRTRGRFRWRGPLSARAGAAQAGRVRRVARVRVARRVRTWGWSFPVVPGSSLPSRVGGFVTVTRWTSPSS
jgi:hypothetical protein